MVVTADEPGGWGGGGRTKKQHEGTGGSERLKKMAARGMANSEGVAEPSDRSDWLVRTAKLNLQPKP